MEWYLVKNISDEEIVLVFGEKEDFITITPNESYLWTGNIKNNSAINDMLQGDLIEIWSTNSFHKIDWMKEGF